MGFRCLFRLSSKHHQSVHTTSSLRIIILQLFCVYKMRCKVVILTVVAVLLHVAYTSGSKSLQYKNIEAASLKVQMQAPKRVKGQVDQIQIHEIAPHEVKEVIMTESVEANPLKDSSHYHRHYNPKYDDKYNYYDKYGKDKYGNYKYGKGGAYDKYRQYDKYEKFDKYGKSGKYDKYDKYDEYDKYDKKDKYDRKGKYDYDKKGKYDNHGKYEKKGKEKKYDEYCYPKQKKMECTAFFFAITAVGTDSNARLYYSQQGSAPQTASTFVAPDAERVHLFSNWARGGYCPNMDIEFGVDYGYDDSVAANTNLTTSLGRFRYYRDSAVDIYEHLIDEGETQFYSYGPYVTDVLIPRGIYYVDAHQTQFGNLATGGNELFTQFDINPVTNQLVREASGQNPCYDAVFFNKECTRWLCAGSQGNQLYSYMKDPATGLYSAAGDIENPQQYSDRMIWYTGTLLCGKMRFASIGYNDADSQWVFVRSRLSLKYPYFKETEVFSQVAQNPAIGVNEVVNTFIYAPPHTNTVFACAGSTFWRFDNAFTTSVTFQPSETCNECFGDDGAGTPTYYECVRITAFKECANEVYVTNNNNDLYYSSNGGVSFLLVGTADSYVGSNGLVGFAVPAY